MIYTKKALHSHDGFTLVEVLAASILGLIAIAGLTVLLKAGLESNRVQQVKSQYITLIKASETWMQTSTAIGWEEIAVGELVQNGILPPSYCQEGAQPKENEKQNIVTCGGVVVEEEIEQTGQFPPYKQQIGVRGVEDEATGHVRLRITMTNIPEDTKRAFEKFFKGKYGADVDYEKQTKQLKVTL